MNDGGLSEIISIPEENQYKAYSGDELLVLQSSIPDSIWTIPLQKNVSSPKAQSLKDIVQFVRNDPRCLLGGFGTNKITLSSGTDDFIIDDVDNTKLFDWDVVEEVFGDVINMPMRRTLKHVGSPRWFIEELRRNYVQHCIVGAVASEVQDDLHGLLGTIPTTRITNFTVGYSATNIRAIYDLIRTENGFAHLIDFEPFQLSIPDLEMLTPGNFSERVNGFFAQNPDKYYYIKLLLGHELSHAEFIERTPLELMYKSFFDTSEYHDRSIIDALFEGSALTIEHLLGEEYLKQNAQNPLVVSAIKRYINDRFDLLGDMSFAKVPHYADGKEYFEDHVHPRQLQQFFDELPKIDFENALQVKIGSPEYQQMIDHEKKLPIAS
ncbi:hypothetical protein COY16_02050 [Candidatus Roizmanbacteria bacterium CG_4_10_14_0_2_um_filter_39_13]|uniref:Uncharacterized protein n=1 Tax=Candidatus Roizmanbacteria bacterium CG_4_10_14_0_2_um_filter_39_13 TaxID=1974825 RepID=A0A2M7U082_9BACT|nr:MAG: hypothetical protein COY16_02050 [Candidatus Roizmanbacteria bacterium CG_4_10_14_0_2_um_filter_39_13]